jgi:gamma-glutamyl hydrolase
MQIGIISMNQPIRNYVKWIELSGAKAVIIPYDSKNILKHLEPLNGVVWTGGSSRKHTYLNNLYLCYQAIKQYNDNGRKFPIWGTCLGFEILILFSMHSPSTHLFEYIQKHPLNTNRPLTLKKSRMKSWFSKSLLTQMENEPCVQHHHKLGFDIVPLPHIDIVSIDTNFINMIEYKDYPFYGVQFHPERPFSDLSYQVSYELSCFLNHECKN